MLKKYFHQFVFLLAICIYGITAFNSHGYYHADEHYQIIELAGLKLGTHTANDLAWEFKATIRSSIQPTISFLLFKTLNSINITDVYHQMFVLRLLTAISALLIIYFFIETSFKFIKSQNIKSYIIISYFLWFLPLINVRYSSETWSGLTFILALAILQSNNKRIILKHSLIGSLLALSFLFRFQIAFLIIGLCLWLYFIKKEKIKTLFISAFFFSLVLLIGISIDFWFYQKFVFTFWNYIKVFIDGEASIFGTSPWYHYIYYIVKFPTIPFGILILASILLLIFKKPKNIFIWCLVPFLVIHSFIQHKEERFLFPIINLIPIILILSYQEFTEIQFIKNIKWGTGTKIFQNTLLFFFIILNFVGLIIGLSKSAGIGRMELTRYIHKKYNDIPVQLLYCQWSSPYNPWQSLPAKFYQEKNIKEIYITSLCNLDTSLLNDTVVNLLVIRQIDLNNPECAQKLKSAGYIYEIQSVPKWVASINFYYRGFYNDNILLLYSHNSKGLKNTSVD